MWFPTVHIFILRHFILNVGVLGDRRQSNECLYKAAHFVVRKRERISALNWHNEQGINIDFETLAAAQTLRSPSLRAQYPRSSVAPTTPDRKYLHCTDAGARRAVRSMSERYDDLLVSGSLSAGCRHVGCVVVAAVGGAVRRARANLSVKFASARTTRALYAVLCADMLANGLVTLR